MYTETIQTLGDQAAAKLNHQRRSLVSHIIRSMLAGMYVGAAIVLIFTIGGSLAKDAPDERAVQPPELGPVIELAELGGLHHRYERRAA